MLTERSRPSMSGNVKVPNSPAVHICRSLGYNATRLTQQTQLYTTISPTSYLSLAGRSSHQYCMSRFCKWCYLASEYARAGEKTIPIHSNWMDHIMNPICDIPWDVCLKMKLAVASWEPLASKESGEGGGVVKGKRSLDWQSNPRCLGFFRRGKWGEVEKKEEMIPPAVNHSGVPLANEAAPTGRGLNSRLRPWTVRTGRWFVFFFYSFVLMKKNIKGAIKETDTSR